MERIDYVSAGEFRGQGEDIFRITGQIKEKILEKMHPKNNVGTGLPVSLSPQRDITSSTHLTHFKFAELHFNVLKTITSPQ